MTGMDDLVSWLRAQLDDDERVARAAHDPEYPWVIEQPEPGSPSWYRPRLLGKNLISSSDPATLTPDEGEHIARWDPTRALAEIDAKRRIMDGLDIDINGEASPWRGCGDDCEFKAIYWAVQVLALPYADRAGYREEWRP